jgi:hypothetical protein
VPWKYRTCFTGIKQGYRGIHDLRLLKTATLREKNEVGRAQNIDVIELAAPLAFGRKLQVFDLPRRRFAFGRDLHAGFRIPFFFVEDGTVKLYFLQPRKGAEETYLTYDELCMVATIHKRFLLDTEFFDQPVDVEYVDVSADLITGDRVLKRYKLDELRLWDDKRLADRLSLIAAGLERAKPLVTRPHRAVAPDRDMPLFD